MFNVVKKDLASISVKITFTKNTSTQEVWSSDKTMVGIITDSSDKDYIGTTAVLQFAPDGVMQQLKTGIGDAFASALADGDTRPFVSLSGLVIPPVKPAMGVNPSNGMMTNNILVSIAACRWENPEIFIDEAPLALVDFEQASDTALQNARQAVMKSKEQRALMEQRTVQAAAAASDVAPKATKKKAK